MRRRKAAEGRERVRIARELHDVIGHALSQINVQASVGLHLMDRDPEQARTALSSIKQTSKTALDEVRSVLGVIRDGDAPLAPQAELAELPRLLRGVESPGFTTELVNRLDSVPGRAAQFAAYRIVQEALTNVVRHAGATRAVVELDHVGDALVVTIDDDGAGFHGRLTGDGLRDGARVADVAGDDSRPADDDHAGTGILGMRERADPARRRGRPRIVAAGRRQGHRAPAVAGRGMIRVALADDQLLVRAGFRALLEAEPDIEVIGEASTGEELLEIVRRDPVDVVLMDIRMPGTDGLWATEQIAADPSLAGVHVVIVTTFELDEYVARAVRAGASGFLVKDTEPVDLLRAVRVVASGEALLSPGVTKRLLERMAVGLRDAPDEQRLAALTDREREVLRLVGQGLTNDEIAQRLVLSPLTAKTHVSRIMSKLHARDRVHLVVVAYESGLVAPGWQE